MQLNFVAGGPLAWGSAQPFEHFKYHEITRHHTLTFSLV